MSATQLLADEWDAQAVEWEERSRQLDREGETRLSGHYSGAAAVSHAHAKQLRDAVNTQTDP